jgi:dTDP-L-rhamnose 4-epimerase
MSSKGAESVSRVLITGGAGFIGSHVADLLLEEGHDVRVYDRLVEQVHGSHGPRHVPTDAEFIRGDMRDAAGLREALRGVDAIVHHAAEVGVGQSMYQITRYVDGNTSGTGVMLELLANERHSVKRIVVASSMSVYGEGAYRCEDHDLVHPQVRDDAQLGRRDWEMRCPTCGAHAIPVATPESTPLAPASIYAISKLDQELMCLAVGRAYDIGVVALRYFNTYGPRQALSNPYTGVAAIFSSRLINGQPPLVFEDGLQLRDLVHVHDVARATVLALTSEAASGEAINIGTGRPVSVLEVAEVLAEHIGVELPARISATSRSGDIRHCWADVTKARELLGFDAAVDFAEGMRELVSWVRKQEADDRSEAAHAELAQRGLAR